MLIIELLHNGLDKIIRHVFCRFFKCNLNRGYLLLLVVLFLDGLNIRF